MAKFVIETEVPTTKRVEYFIEANSIEEALKQIESGECRGEGHEFEEIEEWENEIIIHYEEIEE